jgi:ATP-dependent Zn protease
MINQSYRACRKILEEKKEKIEELAEHLLKNETLSLPDIVEILGERPYPMKENVLEYLTELKARREVDKQIE